MKSLGMNRKTGIIFMVLLVCIVFELVYIAVRQSGGLTREKRMDSSADKILQTCSASGYHPACYDKEIPKLMDTYTMEETLTITKRIQTKDPSYAYCHVLGHAVSARETKKNPALWKDVITRCPSGVCSNGCVHGAFQERFRTDVMTDAQIASVKPELADVCEPRGGWKPTGMEQATCYHAMGHLLMYITGADAAAATALCDELAGPRGNSDHRAVCYDGVFMQIFQPLEPEDYALIRGHEVRKNDVSAFCSRFDQAKRGSCVSESWPLYFNELISGDYAVTHCGQLPENQQKRCMNAIFYILVVQFRFDLPRMNSYCMKLPEPWSAQCFANTASRLIETDWQNSDRAVTWCTEATEYDPDGTCWDELVTNAGFIFRKNSKEFTHICSNIPEPWRKACLEGKK